MEQTFLLEKSKIKREENGLTKEGNWWKRKDQGAKFKRRVLCPISGALFCVLFIKPVREQTNSCYVVHGFAEASSFFTPLFTYLLDLTLL